MRTDKFRKTVYFIVAVFLLCNFFSFSPEIDKDAFSYEEHDSISICIPNGVQLEIKAEKNSSTQIEDTLRINSLIRSISTLKYFLFFAAVLCIECSYFLLGIDARIITNTCSQSFILHYIQSMDGKKRQ